MSAFSSPGNISALSNPYEANRPRLRRQVVSFKQMLEVLKNSQTGSVVCAAIPSYGQCGKEIPLFNSEFHGRLDQLNVADVGIAVKLMPLMLCSTHWEKTVYCNALFLDWLFSYGPNRDTEHYENIVIDYQSAISIDIKDHHRPETPTPSKSTESDQGKSVPEAGGLPEALRDINGFQTVDRLDTPEDDHKPDPAELEHDYTNENLPETSVLVTTDSYASLELGVARLEIMYRESLKCIAMTSHGWRCKEVIDEKQLLKARELLSSLARTEGEFHFEILAGLVLCPDHVLGELPQIYSEKWASFAVQRLPKEEALSEFDTDSWKSVRFFNNEITEKPAFRTEVRRARSASNLSATHSEQHDSPSNVPSRRDFLWPAPSEPSGFRRQEFEFSVRNSSSNSESTIPNFSSLLRSRLSSETPSATYASTKRVNLETSTTISPSVSATAPELLDIADCLNHSLRLTSKSGQGTLYPLSNEPTDTSAFTLGVTNPGVSDHPSRPRADISFVTIPVVNEAVAPEDQRSAQRAQPQMTTTPSQSSVQKTPQGIIDGNIIKEIRSTIPRGGYVYIFKSLDRKLVKIGKATDVSRRKQEILSGCHLQDLEQVEFDYTHVEYPERVEKLVHLELQNFRVKVNCLHLRGASSEAVEQEHREWFDIPDAVAVKSVQLWCSFVDQAYTPEGTIKEHWARMVTLLPKPSFSELWSLERSLSGDDVSYTNLHHQLRYERYRKWIEDGESQLGK